MPFSFGSSLAAPENEVAQGWSPGESEHKRCRKRHRNGQCECPEESSRHAGNGDKRQEHHDRSHRRANQRLADLTESAANRFGAVLSRVPMKNDVLDDDDGIIDDESNRGGKTAERHQIEALADGVQKDEGNGDRARNNQAGHDRSAPIAQKQDEDQSS
jgi:hypothetical protein